jgi:hypothetical protein
MHILILDGHTYHVNIDFISLAMSKELDMLQPLDKLCFCPSKRPFGTQMCGH